MPKRSICAASRKLARKTLIEKHEFYCSWAAVSEEYGGINRGTLCAIANGKRRASESILVAMNIPLRLTPPKPRFNRRSVAVELLGSLVARYNTAPRVVVDDSGYLEIRSSAVQLSDRYYEDEIINITS